MPASSSKENLQDETFESTQSCDLSKLNHMNQGFRSTSQTALSHSVDFHPIKNLSQLVQISDLMGAFECVRLTESIDVIGRSSNGTYDKSKMKSDNEGAKMPEPRFFLYPPKKIVLDWQRALPVGGGFYNIGTNCFINACFQCLSYLPPFANYVLSNEHHRTCKVHGFCMVCEMVHIIATSYNNHNRNMKLVPFFGKFGHNLGINAYRQQDAHEFLRILIESMQSSCLRHHNNLDSFTKETTLISQVFGGFLRSQILCSVCNHKSNTYEPYLDISLEIKEANTIEKALETFVSPESLQDDNAYFCPICKDKVKAEKRFTIHKSSNTLTIHLKRFHFLKMVGKVTHLVRFPILLDIRPYMSDSKGDPLIYNLTGIIVHEGNSCSNGHYYSFINTASNGWFLMNDTRVRPAKMIELNPKGAYILFYSKVSEQSLQYVLDTVPPTVPIVPEYGSNKYMEMNRTAASGDYGQPLKRPTNTSQSSTYVKGSKIRQTFKSSEKRDKLLIDPRPQCQLKQSRSQKSDHNGSQKKPPLFDKSKSSKTRQPSKLPDEQDKSSFGYQLLASSLKRSSATSPTASCDKQKRSKTHQPSQLPSKHEKVSFCIQPLHNVKQSNPQEIRENPRIVMQIKNGKVTTFEKTSNGQSTIVNGYSVHKSKAKANLVPYESDSESDVEIDMANSTASSSQHPVNNSTVPNNKNDHHHKNREFDTTISVPGNTNLLKTVMRAEDLRENRNHKLTVKKNEELTHTVDSHEVNSTSFWHVLEHETENVNAQTPKPNVDINSTTTWEVTDNNGYTADKDIQAAAAVTQEPVRNINMGNNDAVSSCPLVNGYLDSVVRGCATPVSAKSDSCVIKSSISDKLDLPTVEDDSHSVKSSHKKHKKRKHKHNEHKCKETPDESDETMCESSKQKMKKHKHKKKEHKHRHGDSVSQEQFEHMDSKKEKRKRDPSPISQEQQKRGRTDSVSSGSSEYEWVERTKETSVTETAPIQKWDHHIAGQRSTISNHDSLHGTSHIGWDGTKSSSVVTELENQSMLGYGSKVMSWDGNQSHNDQDTSIDWPFSRKRRSDEYEEELDMGKTKKAKKNYSATFVPYKNMFQAAQDGR